ncbi:MAG: hypothetical protein EBR88_09360, partial [Betaproteobacteria bacterium]|nr:hypothetical protein [Betaproteobacteria bacterium]
MFAVCVPTYRRPEVCRRKTLKTLLSGGVPAESITLWVASAEEEAAYRAVIKDIHISVGVPGLAAQRAHIQSQFAPGTRLVFMDDDISMVKRLSTTTGRLEKVTDLVGLFDRGFQEAEKAGAKIWGVYPAASALYMSAGVSTDLRYLIGALYGIIVAPGATLRYGDNQEDKEPLFDTVDTVLDTLRVFAGLIAGLEPQPEAMRSAALEGYSTATDLADYLVKKGLPFRDAHEAVAHAVRLAVERGCGLEDLPLETLQGFSALIGPDVFPV